jgi:ketosteroid isomerase-like protein
MRLAVILVLATAACAAQQPAQQTAQQPSHRFGRADFARLLATVADGWNRNDARLAADCFAEDAVYEEPPARQLHRGRAALFDFFGGNASPPPAMSMTWHHVVFDEETRIGAGEYTFRGRNQYHGIVIIQIANGKIARWREYQVRSDLPWDEFARETRF